MDLGLQDIQGCPADSGRAILAEIDTVLQLTALLRALGWSGPCTAVYLEQKYGVAEAQDKTDLCLLTESQAAEFKAHLQELSNEWHCHNVQ